jgi:hypothetical protein
MSPVAVLVRCLFIANGVNVHPLAVLQAVLGHNEMGVWLDAEVTAVGVMDVGDGALPG